MGGILLAVGATGFEPMTSSTRTKRATGLRHAPNKLLNHHSRRHIAMQPFFVEGVNFAEGGWPSSGVLLRYSLSVTTPTDCFYASDARISTVKVHEPSIACVSPTCV